MKKIFFILAFLLISNSLISSWRQVFFLDQGDFESISCPDSNNCFAIMNHPSTPVLYKSIDQGRNWILIYEDDKFDNPSVKQGFALDSNHYYIADDYYSTLRKSSDGGKTFKEIVLDDTHFGAKWTLRNLAMFDSNYGFVANGYSYFTTKDGWESFERFPFTNNQGYYQSLFLDTNTVVMTCYAIPPLDTHHHMAFVKYYLVENTWDTLFYFDAEYKKFGHSIEHICFINDSLGFGCGIGVDFDLPSGQYLDIIYKTTDGGKNWKLIHKDYQYPYKGLYNNISFADEKNGIAVGFYGKIAMTNDGGDTWVYEPYPNDMKNCRKMQVCWAGRTPLIGTWDRGIFRYEDDFFKFPEDTTSVVEDNVITNDELLITPNPAGDYIEINFERCPTSVRCRTSEKFVIYNVLGECIKTFPNPSPQTLSPNPTTPAPSPQKVNIDDLPAGVYFVRVGNLVRMFVKE